MMTRDEIIDLLSLAAAYDQRTGGEADVKAWLIAAHVQRWTAAAAQRVLVEHYSCGADRPRITVAAISDGIRAVRHKAAGSFVVPDSPEDLPACDYPAWYRSQLARHVDRLLDLWAGGQSIPENTSTAAELGGSQQRQLTVGLDMGTCPPELRPIISQGLRRIETERLSRRRPAVPLPRSVPDDDARRAQARAELDAKRAEAAAKTAQFDAARQSS